ncbi:MAG TPA: hypothetical protein VGP04_20435 [Pseudonocardiaceae bacterium]|nr:hypothetical protein [Pseudonocardiaceae bacterium]
MVRGAALVSVISVGLGDQRHDTPVGLPEARGTCGFVVQWVGARNWLAA